MRYIASILDGTRDVGTGITNQVGGSKFVGGFGNAWRLDKHTLLGEQS